MLDRVKHEHHRGKCEARAGESYVVDGNWAGTVGGEAKEEDPRQMRLFEPQVGEGCKAVHHAPTE